MQDIAIIEERADTLRDNLENLGVQVPNVKDIMEWFHQTFHKVELSDILKGVTTGRHPVADADADEDEIDGLWPLPD
jgi:hypothetical protein